MVVYCHWFVVFSLVSVDVLHHKYSLFCSHLSDIYLCQQRFLVVPYLGQSRLRRLHTYRPPTDVLFPQLSPPGDNVPSQTMDLADARRAIRRSRRQLNPATRPAETRTRPGYDASSWNSEVI